MVPRRVLSCVLMAGTTLLLGVQFCVANADEDAKVVADFRARVKKYADLRSKQAGTSPRPTDSPEKLADSRQDVAGKVQAKRPDASQGDIFTPEIAAYLKRQIAATLAGPEGHKIRASMRHAEPVHGLSLHVNQPYPERVPLQSTPPGLLLNLPPLPKELEYRIVGRNLVLLDTVPNIVVDIIPEAIPTGKD
jgi:hypothetical protein